MAARLRLPLVERREREGHARWMAAVEDATDEQLILFERTEGMSDEELECIIIWPCSADDAVTQDENQANQD